MKNVRNVIVIAPITMLTTPFVMETRSARQSEHSLRAAVVDLLPDLLDDVVFRLEEAEPAPALRDVVDVAGHGVDELVHVVDERRDEQRADGRDAEQDERNATVAREAAAVDAAPLQPARRAG